MYGNGFDPYAGDLYHENPLILYVSHFLINNAAALIPSFFIIADLVCASLLYKMAKTFTTKMVSKAAFNSSTILVESSRIF